MNDDIKLLQGDCIELLEKIPEKSIDMILCDLPYGTTKNKWDKTISLEKLWIQYKRIIEPKGAIVLFSQSPFDKILACSNLEMFRYEWIWQKAQGTGHLNSNFAPLKAHENILIFSQKAAAFVHDKNNAMNYFPQKEKGKPYTAISGKASTNYDCKNMKQTKTINDGTRYPKSILFFLNDKEKFHPTQKPVALCEYLIRTYTTKNMLVLDNCMGSGTTGIACINTDRRFIGMELDEEYFSIAKNRLENALKEKQQDLFYQGKGAVNE